MLLGWTMLGAVACSAGGDDGATDSASVVAATPAGSSAPASDSVPAASDAAGSGAAGSGATGSPATTVPPATAARPAAPTTALPGVSAAKGVFTAAQATRGREVYTTACARCHTTAQHSGATFAATWNNRRVFDLYDILYNTMPLDDPGGLSEQEYVDVVAYILQLNGHTAGKAVLQPDPASLRKLRIDVGRADGQ